MLKEGQTNTLGGLTGITKRIVGLHKHLRTLWRTPRTRLRNRSNCSEECDREMLSPRSCLPLRWRTFLSFWIGSGLASTLTASTSLNFGLPTM
ncbi:jg17445 [Pararge aegeria aegeria]|uniref:Jg17445 protein n=1 Tax=Pararge aegeria aegeria TaxID=348720 RepID=A0A8S4S2W4_9NEOP|nr:jg17445 [Pararge aegeria aegeria]